MRIDVPGIRSHAGRVWLALGIVYIIWGSTYLAIRVTVETIPPLTMAALRFILAGGIMYAWTIRKAPLAERPTRQQWRAAAIIGGLLLVGGNGGVIIAEAHGVPSSVAALMVGTVPLWMALIGRLIYREHLPAIAVIGVVVGFGGVALLARPSGSGSVAYTLLIACGTFAWAAGSLWSRKAPLPRSAFLGTGMEMLCGGVLFAILAVLTGELSKIHPSKISGRSIAALVYLFVFGSLIAFTAYVWLLANARTSLVSTYAYVNPVVAVFLGWLMLNERITGTKLLAGAIIVAAVALIVSAKHPPELTNPPDAAVLPEPPEQLQA